MSRGPGVWQRAILDALTQWECCYLRAVLPEGHTRTQRLAVVRAAHHLAAQGRLQMHTWYTHPYPYRRTDTGHVVIHRPDVRPTVAAAESAWMTAHGWTLMGTYRIVRDYSTGKIVTREQVDDGASAGDGYLWRDWRRPDRK
jgi:hypothetical protein